MRTSLKHLVVGSLLLLGGAACADLEVLNYNEPDATRALSSAGDLEALIAGAYNTWYIGTTSQAGFSPMMSNQSFQSNSPYGNFGMEQYGRIPRISTQNNPADVYYGQISRTWTWAYRSISAAVNGLKALENPEVASQIDPERLAALKAYGKFVQALGHATLALFYDQVFVITEDTDLGIAMVPVSYREAMAEAFAMFDEAIARCGTSFTLPFGWMSADVDNQQLKRLAYSYRARFRAQVARTAEERAAVDWNAVMADADAGITETFFIYAEWDVAWYVSGIYNQNGDGWSNVGHFIHGMADVSGQYQRWVALPNADKSQRFADGSLVLIVTPDNRYPQGTTVEGQRAAPGRYYRFAHPQGENMFVRPDRGTWRWSWYMHALGERYRVYQEWNLAEIRSAEMRLLKAEGLYRTGNRAAAADIVNETRVAADLNPTDVNGTNTSCVPRLPNGQCGDLWEMLKWEKRHETVWTGVAHANWFLDGRGWGDLYKDTPLHYGIPCREVQVLLLGACIDYGGPGGEFGSPGSTYQYPHEGG